MRPCYLRVKKAPQLVWFQQSFRTVSKKQSNTQVFVVDNL